eukprot:COSAG04_NODE_1823_length_5490_cov_4.159866_7_plen_231_part_00
MRLRACWEGLCGAWAGRPGRLRQRGGLWAPGAPARLRCVMDGGWGMVGGAHPEPQAPMHPLALALRPTEAHRSSRSASTACAPTPERTQPSPRHKQAQAVVRVSVVENRTWLPAHEEQTEMVAGGAASSSATCSTHTPLANFVAQSMARVNVTLSPRPTLARGHIGASAASPACGMRLLSHLRCLPACNARSGFHLGSTPYKILSVAASIYQTFGRPAASSGSAWSELDI